MYIYVSDGMICTSYNNKGVLGGSPTLSLKKGINSATKITHTISLVDYKVLPKNDVIVS